MVSDDTVLLAVIGTMAINHIVMRIHALRGTAVVFWALQLINLALGSALIWFGLPGFEHIRAISVMIALLFFFRVVQNNNARQRWLIEELRNDQDMDEAGVKEAFIQALRKSESSDDQAV